MHSYDLYKYVILLSETNIDYMIVLKQKILYYILTGNTNVDIKFSEHDADASWILAFITYANSQKIVTMWLFFYNYFLFYLRIIIHWSLLNFKNNQNEV